MPVGKECREAQHHSHPCRRYGLERCKFVLKPVCSNAKYRPFGCQGMKFTNAYASSVCSPTRASLISGQSEARHNIVGTGGGQPMAPTLCPPKNSEIPRSSYTIAEPLCETTRHRKSIF